MSRAKLSFLSGCILTAMVGALESSCATASPRSLTFNQLISERDHLDRKRVSVLGYFDVDEFLLRHNKGGDEIIAVDLTEAQVSDLKRKGLLRSAYVKITGKFEYVGQPKVIGRIKSEDPPIE